MQELQAALCGGDRLRSNRDWISSAMYNLVPVSLLSG